MNVITRGTRGALRSPIRSGAIILILASSIGLMLAMLVAQAGVAAKIAEVKASTATEITINPAGIQGGMGGGDTLTADQLKTVKGIAHITNVSAQLTDQLGAEDTNLTPSLELGSFGKRMQRFEGRPSGPAIMQDHTTEGDQPRAIKPRTAVTGSNNPASIASESKLTSGSMISGDSSEPIALVGKTLAEKNNLSVGSTFSAYGKTITVKGIFFLDNAFLDSGLIMPLHTLQSLTQQPNAISSMTAKVDSSDNVSSVVANLKQTLGDKADVISQQEQANSTLQPLENIAKLALSGVIGSAIAGATILLLSMIMIVRERRREIGVIKAIGGTDIKVIMQFITEALTLTAVSSIIGIGIGIAVSGPLTESLVANNKAEPMSGPSLIQKDGGAVSRIGGQLSTSVHSISSSLTPQVLASSIGIIILITIIGSAVPAWAIARVRPAEVLRNE